MFVRLALTCAVLVFATAQGFGGHLADPGAPHWSYEGETQPANWGSLSPEYAACSAGKSQSPINLTADFNAQGAPLAFDYKGTPLDIVNNGHTVQVNYQPGSTLTVDGKTYPLVQFHFHTPSEHWVNDHAYDMEMHLVHKTAGGELAVVGVLMQPGQANRFLQSIIDHMPQSAGEKQEVESVSLNAADALPESREYFHYSGSLTTPPCTEGVNWSVLKTPVDASPEQIQAFRKVLGANARPVQVANGRGRAGSAQ